MGSSAEQSNRDQPPNASSDHGLQHGFADRGDLRSSEVSTVARPWGFNRTSQSAHALASVARSSFEVVERGLHLFGSEAMLGNVFDVTSGGIVPQEQPVHRRVRH